MPDSVTMKAVKVLSRAEGEDLGRQLANLLLATQVGALTMAEVDAIVRVAETMREKGGLV